ncbi:MAG TPA: phosphonate ABC transporter, permease protein PhnE [Methylomirabilota bacterium]|jgi:phosphonate transport system permease protein|nr:phosphonate ABC transporter, permease protein PhnE [Methylomirabilota bacterium]
MTGGGHPTLSAWFRRLVALALTVAFIVTLRNVGLLDAERLVRAARNLALFAAGLFPPDPSTLPTLGVAMLETIQIAFAGTAIGFALALPLALLACTALFGPSITVSVKLLLALVRTVPALFWAIVFVVAVGLGPAAGTLAVALYSLGYLGKLLYETFEGVDPEVLEAVRSVGCSRVQLARYALLPEAANGILALLLFMFEYNVRASSIMGFVGAGGIGFYLLGYIQLLRYDLLLTGLLLTLAIVILIDRLSALVRRMFLIPVTSSTPAE